MNTTILLKAVQFAAFKHRKQCRKDADASPYINHPIGVAHLLADVGGVSDIDTLVAAVLHDTIEDTETTAQELEEQFGRTAREVVEEVPLAFPFVPRPSSWLTRSQTCVT